ncbi:MAG TPA: YbaK/EbsC family protein [Burkholderiales bacterium]|nr:YbaK/EbsC family protein [Burkholderiales bacterium]
MPAGGGALQPSAQKVQEALADFGAQFGSRFEVIELPGSARTAREAAEALGCGVAQIAKSIVFRKKSDGSPVLVVASGVNRVDERKVAALVASEVGLADAAFVRENTGFAIGGVPPLGHAVPPFTIVDEDLLALGDIWAAAGTPRSVFRLTGRALLKMTQGVLASVKQ